MSKPWEDPIANAIIDFARAMEKVAAALDKMGTAWLKEAELEEKERDEAESDV